MFLAALMTVSNIYGTVGVLAADVDPEVVSQEEEAVQEDVSVEDPIYEIKLPAYEGCSYSFDAETWYGIQYALMKQKDGEMPFALYQERHPES